MFSAKTGGVLVPAWEVDITARHDQDYTCPDCDEPVVARCGHQMPWHFAHKAATDCPRALRKGGETAAHAHAKVELGRIMASAGYHVSIEEPLGPLRRPDLTVMSLTTGRWCTVEVQGSPLPATEMRYRWAHDHDMGALDTLWVWVGMPKGLGETRNLFLGEEVRYYLQTARCALSVITGGRPMLASVTSPYWMCRDCVVWTRSIRCPRCVGARSIERNDDYAAFELVEATGLPVVCRGTRGPVVRFGAATSPTIHDDAVEAL